MTIETRPVEVVSAPKVKTTADVLRHAAWIIEERGWCQNQVSDFTGRVCAVGAILAAGSGDPQSSFPGFPAAVDTMDDIVGNRTSYWNDRPGRTAAEVTAALRAAADASERAS